MPGLSTRCWSDQDAAGEDEGLGTFARGGVSLVDEQLIEAYFHRGRRPENSGSYLCQRTWSDTVRAPIVVEAERQARIEPSLENLSVGSEGSRPRPGDVTLTRARVMD